MSNKNPEKRETTRELRVNLELDVFEKIEFCKKVSGIQALSDFIRSLINKEYINSVNQYNELLQKEKEMKQLQKDLK